MFAFFDGGHAGYCVAVIWGRYQNGIDTVFLGRHLPEIHIAGAEVDFVIYGKECFWAVEVKNTRKLRRNELRPLKTFHQDYPECQPIFVYRGNERLLIDNILCIPCESFLTWLMHELSLP
jgi:hypothetical protein